jgi:hypothetical protein
VTKTTVYLPEELKRSLERMAVLSGRSEAELIREAVAAHVSAVDRPRPRGGLFESGDSSFAGRAEDALTGFGDR